MKMLDEVIKALEICTSDRGGCEDCPYDPDCKPDKKWDEAIYYLKELQELKNTNVYIPEGYIQAKLGDKNK